MMRLIAVFISPDPQVDFILKWNPRKQDADVWLARAEQISVWTSLREGKRVATFSVEVAQTHGETTYYFRRVMQITERTTPSMDKCYCYLTSKSKAGGHL